MNTNKYIDKAFLFICIPCLFNFGKVKLTSFKTSVSKGEATEGIKYQKREGDVLKIVYTSESNCCFKFKGEVNYVNDTLYLIAVSSGEVCRCLNVYDYNYTIKGITNDNYSVVFQHKSAKR